MRPGPLALSAVAAACVLTAFGLGCGAFGGNDSSEGAGEGEGGTSAEASVAVDGSKSPDGGDGAPATSDPGVSCGGAHCDPRTSLCCTALGNTSDMGCVPKEDASACRIGATQECDDGADCSGGTVCCSTVGSNGKDIFASRCSLLLECKRGSSWVVLCDPSAASPCPDKVACNVPDGGGYGFCALAQ